MRHPNRQTILHGAFFGVAFLLLALTSCQEAEEVDEYDNWQARCEAYIDSIARVASTNADGKWKTIRSFTLVDKDVDGKTATWGTEDYVYCHVEQAGSGNVVPLFTDTVCVNYRGRLMPTTAHPEGYVFDQSFKGEVNPKFNIAKKFEVGALTVGVSTAIQQMHVGDVWRIYIPAALGYGSTDQKTSSGIPAYSALIFDMNLVQIIKP
ncbi:MAG: FKBP-type peptidyl-prolyl cis-trans isomerase [Bacteroidaceae bacterium]|nr:FKBP-type peptidyl-prolyl cis-trans isomerase [Bacteroidaceae bacterium]